MALSGITESTDQDAARFHEALFEYNPCQTIVVDNEGKIITFNKAKRESGDRLPEPGDIIFKDYAAKYDIDMYAQLIECIKTGQTKRFDKQKYVDKFLTTTMSPFPGGATIITEDVTEQKKAEARLRESEEFNRALFDYNPCQTIVVDNQGRIITCNKAKCESGDRLPQEGDVIFKDYAGKYDCDMFAELTECIKTGETKRFYEQKYVDKFLTTTISPFPGGATIITEDVTKRVEAEKELARANEILKEKDELKTAFVSSISHELRTSLCIFNNAISNINAGTMGKVNSRLKETFQMATDSVDRLARVIDDFIELSEIELGNARLTLQQTDVNSICREVIDCATPRLKEKKITLEAILPENACLLNLDRAKITKVLRHLLDNAVKFVPEKGEIRLHVEDRGRDIVIHVKDNGPGIESANIEKVFECFAKFAPPNAPGQTGLGLGLTLAKGVVQMHKGEIIVESIPGKTTTFRVLIPKQRT